MNVAKEIEYDEAPCGYVTFYNYKEPLMKYPEGHGFVGALVFDGQSDKIQCHLCGQWFDSLGHHLNKEHAMRASEYKRTVGLSHRTALINEKIRTKLISKGLERRIKNLQNQKGLKRSLSTRRKIAKALKENRDELKNLRGTCPEQLIQRLSALYTKLGRTPLQEEIPFIEALRKTYGSMKEACMVAGIPYRPQGQNRDYTHLKHTKWPEARIITAISEYYDQHGEVPSLTKILGKGALHQITKLGGRRAVVQKALSFDGRYRKTFQRFRYTKEELLNFLKRFEQINGRRPSYSDCKRGLLPNLSRYSYNFGSWKKALAQAFPN